MVEPLYEIGDTITTHLNVTGTIWKITYNENTKNYIYCYKSNNGMGCVKESNIKKKTNVRPIKQRNKK